MFTCVCGKKFEKIQSLNAHKTHCKEFLGEERYNQLKKQNQEHIKSLQLKNKLAFEEKKKKEKQQWIEEKHICENCGNIITEKYGSGRFCSSFCARSFVSKNQSEESIKKKVEAGKENLEKGRQYMKSIAKPNKNTISQKTKTKKEPKYCLRCNKEIHGKNDYCQNCSQIIYREEHIAIWLKDGDFSWVNNKLKIPPYIKDYILKEQNNKCAICGCDSIWNGKPLIFVCDHINGNALMSNRENLRCICPNCDSQLPTFKSKNKNSKRTWRKKNNDKFS